MAVGHGQLEWDSAANRAFLTQASCACTATAAPMPICKRGNSNRGGFPAAATPGPPEIAAPRSVASAEVAAPRGHINAAAGIDSEKPLHTSLRIMKPRVCQMMSSSFKPVQAQETIGGCQGMRPHPYEHRAVLPTLLAGAPSGLFGVPWCSRHHICAP